MIKNENMLILRLLFTLQNLSATITTKLSVPFWVLFMINTLEGCVHAIWACGLLPGQCLQELVVSDGSEGEIWQDGQQVRQQGTVGCHEVGSYHDDSIHGRGLALSGVLGGNWVAGVCVTLACETHQYMANRDASPMVRTLCKSRLSVTRVLWPHNQTHQTEVKYERTMFLFLNCISNTET